jgi:glycerol-3-phosphate acyltransferase PlsY
MNYFLSAVVGFFLGSIPTAYLIIKKYKNLDITKEGSGNVGTLNSYEVSRSKLIGLAVLTIDFLKGLLSIFIVKTFFANNFQTLGFAFFFVVLGHCFSPWLKFKGGRGLATAAGAASFFIPIVLFLWIVFWLVIKFIKNDIHFANVAATLLIIVISIVFPGTVNKFSFPQAETNLLLSFTISLTMLIILIKHWKPIKDYYYKHKK